MFAFLFGWLVGDNARAARAAQLPESVKQQRYDAAIARKEQRRYSRSWSNPTARVAYVMLAVIFAVAIIANLFR